MSLFAELKRRNVVRVAVLYVIAAWVVLQVADVLFGMMKVPEWSGKLVLGLLALGFPIAMIFSWIYEITPEGLKTARGSSWAVDHGRDRAQAQHRHRRLRCDRDHWHRRRPAGSRTRCSCS